ncbi:MAG TPA: ribonuclease P protein component [Clostridiales bacterium]|jgi:ribonuclease P protein component|nr:ribonuclease P protein component [Clostridiales bacterium]
MSDFKSLTRNGEFRRVYAKGKSFGDRALVIYVFKNRQNSLRLGISTGKKLGNAVVRNRARRIIKEAFRQLAPGLAKNYDYVIVAKSGILNLKSTDVYNILQSRLEGTQYMLNGG